MLNRLVIQNYALIDTLDISFSEQLNILTGETGAGKSIILGALALILGQRAESRYFYNQQKKCVIEGYFHVRDFHLKDFFQEHDLDYDTETVLRREITPEGKSRAFVNDTPVNLAILRQLGESLIDIHSQHATLEINDEKFQLMVVDSLAGNQAQLAEYQLLYRKYHKTQRDLAALIAESKRAKADLDYFQFQFDELERADLVADEQANLEHELNTLTHAEEIKKGLLGAAYLLTDRENAALVQIRDAIQQLQSAEKFNSDISPLTERLKSAVIELKDITSEIEDLEQQTQVNEGRSGEINDRLNIIYSLQKKHRVNSIPELMEVHQGLSEKLSSILHSDENIEKLQSEANQFKLSILALSNILHEKRVAVIPQIEEFVQNRLAEVGMPSAVMKIEALKMNEGDFNDSGSTTLQFLFSANKGQEAAPVNKVASGGELSRLMLSIKSLVAKHTALPTIIFDEIDTGISGEVALKVGNLMETISTNMQVLAITHLPQIASKGNAHYRVFKDEQSGRTITSIERLDDQERIVEVAKMLSGENPGAYALQNAKELLEG